MMTCTVLLEVRVQQEHVASMAEGYKGLFPDSRWFEGCIGLNAAHNMDDPQNFVVVET